MISHCKRLGPCGRGRAPAGLPLLASPNCNNTGAHARCAATAGNSPPRVWHAVLPASATGGRRVILVGDVHGCVEELRRLLRKCGYRRGEDIVVQVGDLVNKGPASAEVSP